MIITKASGHIDSFYGKSDLPIWAVLEKEAQAFEDESLLEKVFWVNPSERFAERLTTKTSMDGAQPVGENGEYPKDYFQEGYKKDFYHETWKNSFGISREAVDDNQVLSIDSDAMGFVQSWGGTREEFAASLIIGAQDTSITFRGKSFETKCNDGLALFSTAHTSVLGATKQANQSNLFSNAFSATALEAIAAQMRNFREDNGKLIGGIRPTTILIGDDPSLKQQIVAAIASEREVGTANNDFNMQYGMWRLIVWPYLNDMYSSSVKPYIIMADRYNRTRGGAMWWDRTPLEVHAERGDNDEWTWKGYSRWSAGFNQWRGFAIGGISGGTTL